MVATATIAGAWIFQFAGYDPCHLCLLQRWAYYFAVPFSLLLSVSAGANPKGANRGLYLLSVVMLGSAIFGAYHAGVEWTWWPGPDTCSGAISGGLPDLTKQSWRATKLQSVSLNFACGMECNTFQQCWQ